jgi:hypothetical protein
MKHNTPLGATTAALAALAALAAPARQATNGTLEDMLPASPRCGIQRTIARKI